MQTITTSQAPNQMTMTKREFIGRIQSDYITDKDCDEMWSYYCGNKYDYEKAVKDDVIQYIEDEIEMSDYSSREELEEYLNEHLWACDSVTGNASGSYTFNTWRAEEYLCHNWGLIKDAISEFGCEMSDSAEACDVTIRCYLLNQAIAEALDEVWEDSEDDDKDEDDED